MTETPIGPCPVCGGAAVFREGQGDFPVCDACGFSTLPLPLWNRLSGQAARNAELTQAAESARAMLRILDRDGFGSIAVGATLLALDKALEVKP